MGFYEFICEVRGNIRNIIKKYNVKLDVDMVLEFPPDKKFGDISTPIAMRLAKRLRRPPMEILEEIMEKIRRGELIDRVEYAEPGYINFYMNRKKVYEKTINGILTQGLNFLFINIGNGQKVRIEHTSVNPNKAIHIGHARNMILGDTLARLLSRLGYEVDIMNYIDDTGVQMADIIIGFKYLGFSLNTKELPFDQYCGDIVYVSSCNKIERDGELLNLRKKILCEIEEGNNETAIFARSIAEKVIKHQLKTAWRLGVFYNYLVWESDIIKSKIKDLGMSKIVESPIVKHEKAGKYANCIIAEVSKTDEFRGEGDEVLVRSDGTMTYLGKDILFAMWKLGMIKEQLPFIKYIKQPNGDFIYSTDVGRGVPVDMGGCDLSINVIGGEQKRPQKILKLIIRSLYGDRIAKKYVHYAYEPVVLSRDTVNRYLGLEVSKKIQRMSGRKGIYINVDPLLDMLKDEALNIILQGRTMYGKDEMDIISENIAVSSLRFHLLSIDRDKLVVFDINKILDIKGESGAYILYSYARANSILKRISNRSYLKVPFEYSNYLTQYENDLLNIISKFRYYLVNAAKNLEPKIIAKYLYDLASKFNEFYEKVPVIKAENNIKLNRLQIVYSFKTVVEAAAEILGLKLVEKM